jgi:hypothetical protein
MEMRFLKAVGIHILSHEISLTADIVSYEMCFELRKNGALPSPLCELRDRIVGLPLHSRMSLLQIM